MTGVRQIGPSSLRMVHPGPRTLSFRLETIP